jgi:ketosteroid isomerase-like protein
VTQDNPNRSNPKQDEPQDEFHGQSQDEAQDQAQDQPQGKEIEEFFQRLPGNFRWPKPNAEAIAAAVEAIHRMSGSAAADADPSAVSRSDGRSDARSGARNHACSSCGASLPTGSLFCGSCGTPLQAAADAAVSSVSGSGQHHFHHHYHHLVPAQPAASSSSAAEFAPSTPRGRAPSPPGTSTGGRAEAGARKVVQDWVQACNTRHIDDLLELYTADATIIRSSVPPVRSLPAIREFLASLLEAGLGDVEMESLRLEMLGDIALDLGRCKMLVPVAMGKRREERGKYLVVLVRQPSGGWKILADCWSSDLAVSAPPEPTGRKISEPTPPIRKPR